MRVGTPVKSDRDLILEAHHKAHSVVDGFFAIINIGSRQHNFRVEDYIKEFAHIASPIESVDSLARAFVQRLQRPGTSEETQQRALERLAETNFVVGRSGSATVTQPYVALLNLHRAVEAMLER